MMLGNIFAERHDRIAINYYNNAIRVNPEMAEAHYALGFFLQEHGNPKGAIKVYDDLLAVDPGNVPAMHNMAYIFLFYLSSPLDAVPWFTKALNNDSTFFLAAYHRGYANEMLGNKDEAIHDYKHALRMYPEMELAQQGLKRLGK
jgi:tetratricopeptide (TPR) repeat protein